MKRTLSAIFLSVIVITLLAVGSRAQEPTTRPAKPRPPPLSPQLAQPRRSTDSLKGCQLASDPPAC